MNVGSMVVLYYVFLSHSWLSTGNTSYRRRPGETTEWEDILEKKGIIPPDPVSAFLVAAPSLSFLSLCRCFGKQQAKQLAKELAEAEARLEEEQEQRDVLAEKTLEELDELEVRTLRPTTIEANLSHSVCRDATGG